MRYAEIIVDLTAEALDRSFTYIVPDELSISEGDLVKVPFGKKIIEGFVVDFSDKCELEPSRLKPVMSKSSVDKPITEELMGLCRWMRDKYSCTMADALRLMIPAEMRLGRVKEKTFRVAELLTAVETALERCKRAPMQAWVVSQLTEPKPVKLLEQMRPGSANAASALEKKGIVGITEVRTLRKPLVDEGGRSHTDPFLTPAQQNAANELINALNDGGGRYLLHGVTGSGKTEVYIKLIREALNRGRDAIILVPEIALTPQMVGWFHARFGANAAVIHSRLSAGERYDEWERIRSGDAHVVIGARSAVFAPVADPGVIVIDEEHEGAYSSEKRPRYDAREVAAYRVGQSGGVLVLGSATPSITSYMRTQPNVKPENKLKLIELSKRANGKPLPECEIVDMREELQLGNRGIFSAALINGLKECIASGKQAILFMNRRGHSTFVSCRACGYVEKCEACNVTLTYHQTDGSLKCHYCGYSKQPPTVCPNCGSKFIKYFGAGTQKIEEEVVRLFPKAKVLRMDQDTTAGKDAHAKILSAFGKGEADILVGTQMIAKGLDFPNVTLVGVVAADTTLNLPDYRSAERTFQLVTQVAGRAGRADTAGKVIVQTYEPEHYALKCAVNQDYRAFYNTEANYRKRSYYPPYTTIMRIVCEAKTYPEAESAAKQLEISIGAALTAKNLMKFVLNLNSGEAPINKLRGLCRAQVYVRVYSAGDVKTIISEMETLTQTGIEGCALTLEVNPANMV